MLILICKDNEPHISYKLQFSLISAMQYYTQTHKLCNCLEKLLLVTSSTRAFGGSTGGITSQSRLEVSLAARSITVASFYATFSD
jgi:hypothetical protein